ncbi:Plasma-membrane_choline transporter and transmembrane domain-containing protein [Hexamita inflata]|uniref:Choline transporter-like protein n=1 Tax=Hexamita inflata TaxID=28002 RepID=A0AA86UR06_9EUKA|nr:Plasma-membrane choline transporter and transmembrane domain-containing protein [Hexamita inflata]
MDKNEQNPVLQPAADKQTSEKASLEYSPIADKSKRKCRDIFCLLMFTTFWGLCFAICITHKVWDNTIYAKLLLEPHDRLRRRCGYDHADQQDMLATDYSKIVSDPKDITNFCTLSQTVHNTNIDVTGTNCASFANIGATKNEMLLARQFMKLVSEIPSNSDRTGYGIGFKTNSGKHCLKDDVFTVVGSKMCNPPNGAMDYVCDSDFEIYYNAAMTKVNPIGTAIPSFTQFLSTHTYNNYSDKLTAEFRFVLNFCTPIPKGTTTTDREDYSLDSVPNSFGILTCSQSMIAGQFKQASNLVGDFSDNFVSQIIDQYAAMCIGLGACLLFMIIYFIFLRYFVGVLIWITVIGSLGSLATFGAYLICQGKKYEDQNQINQDYFGYVDAAIKKQEKYYEGIGWTIVAIDIIFSIIVLIFFKTIRIATAVIKQAMVAIGKVPIIFIFPIFSLIFVIAHLFWSVMGSYMFYLTGSYDATVNAYNFETKVRGADGLVIYTTDHWSATKFAVLVFGCIWGTFFFYSLLEFNISMMVVQWYFNRERTKKSLRGSMKKSILYGFKSLGTLTVTSFITSWFFFIRIILEYVLKRMNTVGSSKVVKAAVWFTRCCLSCIQKIVEWFNRNIQIYAAISGDGYCKSMKGAVKLLMAKIFSNLFANNLSSFFLFIGKLLTSAVGAIVCGSIIYADTKQIMLTPTIFTLLGSFFLSYFVIEIVKLVIDTIYFCFLYEETYMMREREQGLKPYAPGDFAKLM